MNDQELEFFRKKMEEFIENQNRLPNPELDNLSPSDLELILYQTFEPSSPIQFREPSNSENWVEECPFIILMIEFLERVRAAGEIKLTTRGNLPRKLCLDLYGLGLIKEEVIEKGVVKLSKEQDSIVLQNIKFTSTLSGLTKKRNGKLSLTAKGQKILNSPFKLLKDIFIAYSQKLNWGYHDSYLDEGQFQSTFGYLLYLLIQYGKEERSTSFYSEKHAVAFPMIFNEAINHSPFSSEPTEQYERMMITRSFKRFLDYFGMIELREEGKRYLEEKCFVKTTDLFQKLFQLDKSKFHFIKPEGQA